MKSYIVKFTTTVGPMKALTRSQARVEAPSPLAARLKAEAHQNVIQVLSVEEDR